MLMRGPAFISYVFDGYGLIIHSAGIDGAVTSLAENLSFVDVVLAIDLEPVFLVFHLVKTYLSCLKMI